MDSFPTADGLTLRQWQDEDAHDLVDIYREQAMRRWVRVPVDNHDDAIAWVEAQREGWHTGERLCFAVLETEQLVGCVVLKSRSEVGYWTAARVRGRGIATRAVDALSTWAFARYGVAELVLRHQVDNEASCRVARKAGYRLTATVPATPPFPLDGHLHVRTGGRPVDQASR